MDNGLPNSFVTARQWAWKKLKSLYCRIISRDSFFLKQSLFSIVYEAIISLLSENILQLYVMNIKTFLLTLTNQTLSVLRSCYLWLT